MPPVWWNDGNTESRRRLAATVARLDAAALGHWVFPESTVGALLGHLGWWDDYLSARWNMIRAGQDVPECSEALEIVLNAAGTPAWLALNPADATAIVIHAAGRVDALIESLTADEVAWAMSQQRTAMLDRASHRHLHLDQIDQALAQGGGALG